MDDERRPPDIKKRTFSFAVEIVRFCDALDSQRGTVRTLGRQLLRAGTSVGANVEEAQAGQSRADFISKYSIALKEACESIYWLRLLKTTGMCADDNLKPFDRRRSKLLGLLVRSLSTRGKVAEGLTFSFFLLPLEVAYDT
jgi:four helix bundle protein